LPNNYDLTLAVIAVMTAHDRPTLVTIFVTSCVTGRRVTTPWSKPG